MEHQVKEMFGSSELLLRYRGMLTLARILGPSRSTAPARPPLYLRA